MESIDLQVLREWVWWRNLLGERSQNHVLQLNGMLGQRIDKVEMEVAQELWVILQDYQHDSHDSRVEALQGRRRFLAWDHVVLQECEALHDQVLDLALLLVLIVALSLLVATRVH